MNQPATQSVSAVLASVCIHLVLLVGMALVLMGGLGRDGSSAGLLIDASQASTEDEPTQLDLTSSDSQTEPQEPHQSALEVDFSSISSHSTSIAKDSSEVVFGVGNSSASGAYDAFAEAAVAAMTSGSQSDGPSKESEYGQGVSFFGAYAPGQRFVFVIDSSRSMLEGTRWVTLRRELVRAIKGLSPDQEFFVISFDVGAHPMFDQYPPQSKFMPPTEPSIYRLNTWLNSINHGGATLPASSIGLALGLKPDAIFLLSDGEIQDNTVQDLRIYNRRKEASGEIDVAIPIHTVLLHSPIGAATLKVIADENDGVFTPVSAIGARP